MKLRFYKILLLATAILVNSGFSQERVEPEFDSLNKLDSTESALPAGPRSSSAFEPGKVAWQAVLTGGSLSASEDLHCRDASGQIAVGAAATDDFRIYQGFLQVFLLVESCRPGDANGDGMVDVDDAVYLLNHIFALGPDPADFCCADVSSDGKIDIDDVVYLVMYSFAGGPEPRRGC